MKRQTVALLSVPDFPVDRNLRLTSQWSDRLTGGVILILFKPSNILSTLSLEVALWQNVFSSNDVFILGTINTFSVVKRMT